MTEQNTPLKIQKRLLQFNNLPISFGEIDDQTYTASFKGESVPYTNRQHGSYYQYFGEYGILNSANFDATLTFSFKDVACGDKPRYARFIKRQLAKSGKLWAVQNGGEVIWANARVLSVNESVALPGTNTIKLAVTFELIDGYWVYAWETRTFLAPYCVSRFIDFDDQYCWEYEGGRCDITGTVDRCLPCYKIETEVNTDADYKPLCSWTKAEITEYLGSKCPKQFHIRYDCDLEADYFCYDAAFGDKYKLSNRQAVNSTTINYCSRTDLPTNVIQIRLRGSFTNPTITVNDDKITLSGDYPNGTMVVVGFGVGIGKYVQDANNREKWTLSESLLNKATITNIPYFELNPGKNTITVTGNEMDKPSYVYVKPLEITY